MRVPIDKICYDIFQHEWFTAYQLVDALADYHDVIMRGAHYMTVHQVAAKLRIEPNIERVYRDGINYYRVRLRSSEKVKE